MKQSENSLTRWEQPVVIAGNDNCSFCKKAEELCREKGAVVRVYDVDKPQGITGNTLAHIFRYAGFTTVPIIFHAGQLIGGYKELEIYLELGYVP